MIKPLFNFLALFINGCLFVASCSQDKTSDSEENYPEVSSALFRIDSLMQVEIDIDSQSWDALRYGSPHLEHYIDPDCPNGPRPRAFEWFEATASINGEDFGKIEIRKKGLKGSMEAMKPSLKLRFQSDNRPSGIEHMTLNNSIVDKSWSRECLSYHLFRKAGLVAPRCGLAQVSVNGRVIGIYTHIEEVKGPLLDSQFGDSEGDLYELTKADFVPELIVMFEPKRDETNPDPSNLEALAEALEADDDDLFEALGKSLDLDWFFNYWAMEVVTAHWDGYSGNANNCYVYRKSDDGLFRFIPWGTDASFETPKDSWGPVLGRKEQELRPRSDSRAVYAHGAVARRLFAHPQGRERYEESLRKLLEEVWDEKELTDMVDTIMETISPDDELAKRTDGGVDGLKSFIKGHKAQILEELHAGLSDWDLPLNPPSCAQTTGKSQTRTVFEGELTPAIFIDQSVAIDIENPKHCNGRVIESTAGEEIEMDLECGWVEYEDTHLGWRNVKMNIGFLSMAQEHISDLEIIMPEELFYSGSTIPLDFGSGRAMFYHLPMTVLDDPTTFDDRVEGGFIATGEMTLDNLDAREGGSVEVSFVAPLVTLEVP